MCQLKDRIPSHVSLALFFACPTPSPRCLLFFAFFFKKQKQNYLLFIFVIVRTNPRALHMLDKFFTTDLHPSHVGVLRSPFPCSSLESGTLSAVTPSLLLYFIQRLRWSHPPQHLGA